jgi:hypothetical protein
MIFLLFLSIPVITGIMLFIFYKFSGAISSRPVDITLELMIACMPAVIILSTNTIFLIRTKNHPSKIIRAISYCCFMIGMGAAVTVIAMDIPLFFKAHGNNIIDYKNYSLVFIAGTIGLLFLVALMQAFTTKKEVHWTEKHRGIKE